MSGIEERIAEVLRTHTVIGLGSYTWSCCGCEVDFHTAESPDAHVAAVLVAELGLTQQRRQHPEQSTTLHGGCEFTLISVRYVTGWEPAE